MGRLGRIISGISSGLREIARKAEQNIGNFEKVFGEIKGPERGMAGSSRIMQRLADTGKRRGDRILGNKKRKRRRGRRRKKRGKKKKGRRRRRRANING